MTKEEILHLLWYNPVEIGHWVGFKDLTELHNEWLRSFLYYDKDQTLQGHRGSYKTTTLSLFFALHLIEYPNETVSFFRKTSNDVGEVIKQTSNILRSGCINEIVKILYKKELVLYKSTRNEIHTNLSTSIKGTSQIIGLGIGTSITGKHADIVCTDDIVNINDRVSYAERERTKMAYQELQNIKNRGGRFINTGTPWHKEDCFTLMPEPVKYPWNKTGLITEEQAKEIKSRMTNSLFSANYELKHIASEDIIFDNPQTGADICNIEQAKYCHIDAAYGGEDYTAFTICKKHDGKYYVLGKLWGKHVDDCEDEIISIRKKYNAGRILCETNGDKGYLGKELRKKGERVVTYHEGMNKFLKITSYLKNVWKDVIFVEGTDKNYIDMICDYNENAEHDDAPDSLASIIRKLWGRKDQTDNQEERERYNVYLQ